MRRALRSQGTVGIEVQSRNVAGGVGRGRGHAENRVLRDRSDQMRLGGASVNNDSGIGSVSLVDADRLLRQCVKVPPSDTL